MVSRGNNCRLAVQAALISIPMLCGFAVKPKTVSLCEVLMHEKQYVGKRIIVTGIVEQQEHGRFLAALSACDPRAIELVEKDEFAYYSAGGSVGHGVQATLDGEIVESSTRTYFPTNGHYFRFWATSSRYDNPK